MSIPYIRTLNLNTEDSAADEHHDHLPILIGLIVSLSVLALYIFIGSFMEIMHFPVGHETGVIILIGILISWVTTLIKPDAGFLKWNNEMFFFVYLPLIIFATGYNMQRKNFFANIANVAKFGLVGTTLTFIFYSTLVWLVFNFIEMTKYNPVD